MRRQRRLTEAHSLAIIHALLFDFLNFRTGQLDPAYEAIARAAFISVRSVARGLQALKDSGVLFWQRRCKPPVNESGDFLMERLLFDSFSCLGLHAYPICHYKNPQGRG
jgi:hypothetical protein